MDSKKNSILKLVRAQADRLQSKLNKELFETTTCYNAADIT